MENSLGLVAVFAVSGSVVLLARQLHKRLVSDFMKQIECELGGSPAAKCHMTKKKVRFANDVVEPSSNNEEYRKKHASVMMMKHGGGRDRDEVQTGVERVSTKEETAMPLNRQVLYKGIIEYKTLRGQFSHAL